MKDEQIRLDFERPSRVGFDEAILCARKSHTQLETIMDKTIDQGVSCLMTRLSEEIFQAISEKHRANLNYDPISRTAYFNWKKPDFSGNPQIAVVTAGSSDMPVAQEALRTLTYFGIPATSFIDVGVAGLWRLTSNLDALRKFPVIIVIAGMDGALPSVLGGLVPSVIIVAPTSTGYGVSRGGETALNAALASCAPGLCVVNIDNGYGAACAAFRVVSVKSSIANLPTAVR